MEGEKCTKFFFNLEKSRGKQTIKEIIGKDGRRVKETKEILKEIKDYYEDLFNGKGINKTKKEFLLEHITLKLEEHDRSRGKRDTTGRN